jgi:hypothetical protein
MWQTMVMSVTNFNNVANRMKSSSGPLKTRDLSLSQHRYRIFKPSGKLRRGFKEPVDTSVTVFNQTRRHNQTT